MRPRSEGLGLQRGEEVEVLGLDEIRATLDARGELDGMPFMAEMARYAGRRARVWRRADRVCVEGYKTQRRLRDTVFLEELRCDGAAHGGCQRACLLMWNEAWLRRPTGAASPPLPPSAAPKAVPPPPQEGAPFFCQSTALPSASTALPPAWHPAPYLRDLASGNLTLRELARAFIGTIGHRVESLASRRARRARPTRTPGGRLGLVPGEWVEVKSREEIEATLDPRQKNRGLEFSPGMSRYCGRRFRVSQRLERMVVEPTGEMRALADTVLLQTVVCDGACSRGCPRANPIYWREIWLRRVNA